MNIEYIYHQNLQDNFCHLVAPSVTSLDVALAMISNPGVDSYTLVEQVMKIIIVEITMIFRNTSQSKVAGKLSAASPE